MSSSKLIVSALALAATLGSGPAQARDYGDVQWSVSIGGPIGVQLYSQPYPAYSRPLPVFVQPYPAYRQRHEPVRAYQQPTRWDRDGDGVPNRYDRNDRQARGDRDGDGTPNWQDRRDGRRGFPGARAAAPHATWCGPARWRAPTPRPTSG